MKLVERAEQWARRAHVGQTYGTHPYADAHLARVVGVLRETGIQDEALLAAGWLHDILEDTDVTADMLYPVFGPQVTELVIAVTSAPGRNRRERNAATYPKIARDPRATVVKLADRTANVEASRDAQAPQLQMYRKEHPGFRAAIFVAGLDWPEYYVLWERLERALQVTGA